MLFLSTPSLSTNIDVVTGAGVHDPTGWVAAFLGRVKMGRSWSSTLAPRPWHVTAVILFETEHAFGLLQTYRVAR